MDFAYMGKVLLSVILLTPGMVVLGFCLFVGFLILLEKAGLLSAMARKSPPVTDDSETTNNPSAQQVVMDFKRALADGPRPAKDV